MIVSMWATTSLEEVATASGSGLRWFQLQIFKDKQLTYQLVKRAEKAGYRALVLTVDAPEVGKRHSDVQCNFKLSHHLSVANFQGITQSSVPVGEGSDVIYVHIGKALISPSVTWDSVDWLRSLTSLPIILKGILTAEDARIALQHNVQGILVSNHGARQLDGVPATVS